MGTFTATTTSHGVVPSSRAEVWSVLTDADLVARLTPFVHSISTDGDLWRWQLTSLPVLGTSVTPAFTEQMTFVETSQIDYSHAPPHGRNERYGVEGRYALADADGGTELSISLEVCAELPMPRVSGPAVRAAMGAVIGTMGAGFERNFRRHLGG
ncbi:MAG: hypothetical protein WBQ50_18555 [Nocardioides sp.]